MNDMKPTFDVMSGSSPQEKFRIQAFTNWRRALTIKEAIKTEMIGLE